MKVFKIFNDYNAVNKDVRLSLDEDGNIVGVPPSPSSSTKPEVNIVPLEGVTESERKAREIWNSIEEAIDWAEANSSSLQAWYKSFTKFGSLVLEPIDEGLDKTTNAGHSQSNADSNWNPDEWVITPEIFKTYKKIFELADEDSDGFISGFDAVQARILIPSSKLSIIHLAAIWLVSDVSKDRRLDLWEFCVLEFLMDAKSKGKQIPQMLPKTLHPDFIKSQNQVEGIRERSASQSSQSSVHSPQTPHTLQALQNSQNITYRSPASSALLHRKTNSVETPPLVSLSPELNTDNNNSVTSTSSNSQQTFSNDHNTNHVTLDTNENTNIIQPNPDQPATSSFWKKFSLSNISKYLYSGDEVAPLVNAVQRPSGLPPKDPNETIKHLKELEKMEKRAKKLSFSPSQVQSEKEIQQLTKEKRMTESAAYFQEVIKTWPRLKTSSKTRQYWWQGLPPKFRGKLWELTIGNDLNITKELFEIFGGHAKRARDAKDNTLGREESVQLIPLDLPRTFPALSIFQPNGPCHGQLRDVLEAYVCYRPDVGYVQGMSFIAAVLLLNMDTYPAFQCLANLLNKPTYLSFYKMDTKQMDKYAILLERLMFQQLPKVQAHLDELNITANLYLVEWIMTLYAKPIPLDVAVRIWDAYVLEGEHFIFRTALGIMKYFSRTLEVATFDEIVGLLTHLPTVDEEGLFQCIEKIDLTQDKFVKLLQEISTDL